MCDRPSMQGRSDACEVLSECLCNSKPNIHSQMRQDTPECDLQIQRTNLEDYSNNQRYRICATLLPGIGGRAHVLTEHR